MFARHAHPSFVRTCVLLAGASALFACAADIDTGQNSVESAELALSACPPKIPEAIAVPAGNRLAFRFHAEGVQIYDCTASTGGFAWVFRAPDADLFRPNGCTAGSHYAGPTWESVDGSTVVGTKVAAATVDASAIPWLLLQGTGHSGSGAMSDVTYVQRLNTTGGLAPNAASCDEAHANQSAEVPYTADYYFFEATPAHKKHG